MREPRIGSVEQRQRCPCTTVFCSSAHSARGLTEWNRENGRRYVTMVSCLEMSRCTLRPNCTTDGAFHSFLMSVNTLISRHQAGVEYQKQRGVCSASRSLRLVITRRRRDVLRKASLSAGLRQDLEFGRVVKSQREHGARRSSI